MDTRSGHQWAVVLAGGDGVRVRPLIRRLFGDERPKQYAPLVGARSLLRQTLDRVALLIALERTVIVSQPHHARYLAVELDEGGPRVLFQPQDRGTGAGVLYSTHRIERRDPEATVAVFPSDHFVLEESAFMAHVAAALDFVGRHPQRLVFLAARPTDAHPQCGWVRPGEPLPEAKDGLICRVSGFREEPGIEAARTLMAEGWLWNTGVFVGSVSTLIRAGRELLAPIEERLERMAAFAGTEHEAWALRQAYALAPACDFSRTVLRACPSFLAVSPLPALTWSDLGTSERVLRIFATRFGWPPSPTGRPRRGRDEPPVQASARKVRTDHPKVTG